PPVEQFLQPIPAPGGRPDATTPVGFPAALPAVTDVTAHWAPVWNWSRRWRRNESTMVGRSSRMPTTLPAPGRTPDAMLQLSAQTVAWLADHPRASRFVGSVWDKLSELERAGHYPGAIDALRRVLIYHQPTPPGRCRTRRHWTSRRRPFPCVVWHQIRNDLGAYSQAAKK
ncbi:MAG: hypothetical protein ACRDS9_10250, partial [Pseudonocardiaceae bacterium]